MSAQQQKIYQASSEILLNRQDLGSTLTGLPTQSHVTDPVRYATTQAQLARVPGVLQAALRRADVTGPTRDLAGSSDVSADPNTDILTFTVDHNDPANAIRLATAYAQAFVADKLRTETASLQAARGELQSRLAELREAGASDTDTYRQLAQQAQSMRTLELLEVPASVVRPADSAPQIAPRPRRTPSLEACSGSSSEWAMAFGLNALDRRVRSADEVDARAGHATPLAAERSGAGQGRDMPSPDGKRGESVGHERLELIDDPAADVTSRGATRGDGR